MKPKKTKPITADDFINEPPESIAFKFYAMSVNDFFSFRLLLKHYKKGEISARGLLNLPSLLKFPFIVKRQDDGTILLSDTAQEELLRFNICQELLEKHSSPYLSLAVKFDDAFAEAYMKSKDKDINKSEELKKSFDDAWVNINMTLASSAMTAYVYADEELQKKYSEEINKQNTDEKN